mmetsp:Transcript_21026/g.24241  ORF Transcript_21026/g.24241 Transcript_21026/m.24241 type:complete len:267 (-) Transcript_21026:29-829(-)
MFTERCKRDEQILEAVKKRLEDTYNLPESKCQEVLSALLKKYKGEEIKEFEKFDLFTFRIDFNKEKDMIMFEELGESRVPTVHSLFLSHIKPESYSKVSAFFKHNFPNKLNALIFNFSSRPNDESDLVDLSKFIEEIIFKSVLIVEEIQIWNCKITAADLNLLVTYFAHCKKFHIYWSKFDFSDEKTPLDFRMAFEPAIEEVSFEGCGAAVLNDWANDDSSLHQIMKAFERSEIKSHIKQVILEDCDLEEDRIREIMETHDIKYAE